MSIPGLKLASMEILLCTAIFWPVASMILPEGFPVWEKISVVLKTASRVVKMLFISMVLMQLQIYQLNNIGQRFVQDKKR